MSARQMTSAEFREALGSPEMTTRLARLRAEQEADSIAERRELLRELGRTARAFARFLGREVTSEDVAAAIRAYEA